MDVEQAEAFLEPLKLELEKNNIGKYFSPNPKKNSMSFITENLFEGVGNVDIYENNKLDKITFLNEGYKVVMIVKEDKIVNIKKDKL